jgi:hypothetical protein
MPWQRSLGESSQRKSNAVLGQLDSHMPSKITFYCAE